MATVAEVSFPEIKVAFFNAVDPDRSFEQFLLDLEVLRDLRESMYTWVGKHENEFRYLIDTFLEDNKL